MPEAANWAICVPFAKNVGRKVQVLEKECVPLYTNSERMDIMNGEMNKKLIAAISAAAVVVVAIIGFLIFTMHRQKVESEKMLELAEMDKMEMENEYEQFAMQYNEMKMQINNDSLVAQLEQEQKRTDGGDKDAWRTRGAFLRRFLLLLEA